MIDQRISYHQSGAANAKLLLLIIAVAILAAGVWLFSGDEPGPEPSVMLPAAPPQEAPPGMPATVERAPDIPLTEPEQPLADDGEPGEPLPPLEDSDDFARQTLAGLGDAEELELWLRTDSLVQKATSIIDGFSRGHMLYKAIPIQPPEGAFKVVREDDAIYLDTANYRRYDRVVDVVTSIPAERLAETFHLMRPLFEEAYSALGYPSDRVDNSLVAAIDLALATPDVSDPIALRTESVLYQFSDPTLESLPQLQKQMIRMGPDNRDKIKTYLSHVRTVLLQEAP